MLFLSCLLCRGQQPETLQNCIPCPERGNPTRVVKEPSSHKKLELATGPVPNSLQAQAGLDCMTDGTNNFVSDPELVRPAAFEGNVKTRVVNEANAASLLEGMSFTKANILGVGTYGITVKCTLNGFEVAVKFTVATAADNQTPQIQNALAYSQALRHPHICKVYETRSVVLTGDLFDELEANRQQYLQRQHRQKELLQQPQPQQQNPTPATDSGLAQPRAPQTPYDGLLMLPAAAEMSNWRQTNPSEANRNISWVRPAAIAKEDPSGSHRRRIYYQPRHTVSCRLQRPPVSANSTAPLESESPFGVLHEVLHRMGAATGQQLTVLVLEYCSRGTLYHAMGRSIFHPCRTWGLRVARRALVRSMAELARAMLHLHLGNVVHGDLKPSNVLLHADKGDRRGFTIKVSDVALTHLLHEGGNPLSACKYGTPQYMAPEALLGHMGPAADVWSFGVVLCEAMAQAPPYDVGNMRSDAVVLGIIRGTLKLQWPPRPASVISVAATTSAPSTAAVATAAFSNASASASDVASGRGTVGCIAMGDSNGGVDSSCRGSASAFGGYDFGEEDRGICTAAGLAQHLGLQFRASVSMAPEFFDTCSPSVVGTGAGIISGAASPAMAIPSTIAASAIATSHSTITTAAVTTAAATAPGFSSSMFGITESQDPGFSVPSAAATGTNFMLTSAAAEKYGGESGFLAVDNAALLRRNANTNGRNRDRAADTKLMDARASGAANAAAIATSTCTNNTKDLDLDMVLDCLITLGRRCTHRDPEQRPSFAEILGELTDLDVIMKSQRYVTNGAGGGGGICGQNVVKAAKAEAAHVASLAD